MANDIDMKRRTGTSPTSTLVLQTDGTSPDIDMTVWAGFGYVVTTSSGGAATLIYWGARAIKNSDGSTKPGTYGQIFDNTNSAVTQAFTNGNAYTSADQCFPWGYIQVRPNAGTATIELSKKS